MAYTKQHLRLIVRALALTGSPIGALRWLARNSLELGHIRLKTLRKFSKRPDIAKLSQTKASASPKESSRPGRLDENAKTELVEKFSKLKDMLKTIQSPGLHDDKDKLDNNLDAENKETELA
jgi:hypothetical protein